MQQTPAPFCKWNHQDNNSTFTCHNIKQAVHQYIPQHSISFFFPFLLFFIPAAYACHQNGNTATPTWCTSKSINPSFQRILAASKQTKSFLFISLLAHHVERIIKHQMNWGFVLSSQAKYIISCTGPDQKYWKHVNARQGVGGVGVILKTIFCCVKGINQRPIATTKLKQLLCRSGDEREHHRITE